MRRLLFQPCQYLRKIVLYPLNSDGNGFFRVIYEEEFYTNLKDKVQFFTDIDRAEIVNDAYSLLLSGKMTIDKYFRILNDLIPGVTTPVITLVLEEGSIKKIPIKEIEESYDLWQDKIWQYI